ncbi:MAG: hypothetical protein ACK4RK_06230 [Gemmataceae bacterium]
MYPSGRWRGYWEQPGWGRQAMHDLILRFADGCISGSGHDCIGLFTFEGRYDPQGGVTLRKQYLGRHQVLYVGSYDGEGTIFGHWSISPAWTGPFALRLDHEEAAEDAPIARISAVPVADE